MSAQWKSNEAELARLRDLPAGSVDPAAREAELEAEQDELEYEIARHKLHEQRGQLPG